MSCPAPSPMDAATGRRVLLADDEPTLLGAYERMLTEAGYTVETALDVGEAAALLALRPFDVLVADLSMPGGGGIQLLRVAREHDLDLPVVLITGTPSVETAMKAVEHGALKYLVKPVSLGDLEDAVAQAAQLRRVASLKREALQLAGDQALAGGDRAGLEVSFERGLRSLWMAYQPIVSWSEKSVYSYEALLRCTEPSIPHPGAFLGAAERLGRIHDLGGAIRRRVAGSADTHPSRPRLFVNLHPQDLLDEELYLPSSPLSRIADRVVLEVTERASLEKVDDVTGRITALRSLGYQIAIDDLGAGYAGLSSFAQLQPEVIKIDMSLVRRVDVDPTRRKLVASLAALCRDMGMLVVAEGVETTQERDSLVALGCDLLQGHLFARPGRAFVEPTW